MDRAKYLAAALVTFSLSGLPLLAQQGGTAQQPGTPRSVSVPATDPGQAGASAAQPAGSAVAPATTEMKPVNGELVGKLDSKNARQGDSVVVKTKDTVTTADGTEIPKGSKLIGHVALVHPHSKDMQNSQLALLFDHAELKGGQDVPIHSTIQSLAPPEGEMASSSPDMMTGAPMAGSAAGGGAMGGSRTSSGGTAATGGASTSAPGSSPAGAPVVNGTSDPSAQSGAGTPAAGQVVAGSGANAIRTTSIPNVFLASDAAGPVSGTLFSAKSNVHLDSGTRMVLDVAAANSH
jgi:hypothetical protein